jgi:hypothetical protein
MSVSKKPSGLKQYLENEHQAVEVSLRLHGPEFELFCELAELYERLGNISRIKTQEAERLASPAKLFQVVMCQMYGVGSLLLRRRLVDASALSRRAIESTAIAYRLWKHPDLRDIYETAYPDHMREDHPKQWRPSFKYNDAFKLDQLFSEPEEIWTYLRSVHDAFSASATHAGPLATAFHIQRDGEVVLQFMEGDNGVVRITWNQMLRLYGEILQVFLRIVRNSGDQAAITGFRQDLSGWVTKVAKTVRERNRQLGANKGQDT